MNAPLEHPAVAEPHWREHGFMQSLGSAYGTELPAQPLPDVHWVARSDALAAELGVADWLHTERALQVPSGCEPARERPALASVCSGHEFAVWVGQLGDGRALLRSSIREFPCAEAMHHPGIPTTRALAIVGSPAPVMRQTVDADAGLPPDWAQQIEVSCSS